MVKAVFNGLTEQHTMVSLLITTLRVKVSTFGQINENTKEVG